MQPNLEELRRIFVAAARKQGAKEVAEDLAQDALIIILKYKDSIRNPEKVGYYFKCFLSVLRNHFRHEIVRSRGERRAARPEVVDEPPTIEEWPTVALLDYLPRTTRAIARRYYVQGQKVRTIAKALHKPKGTIQRELWNARQALAALLKAEGKSDP